jgi:hypothetical protein
MTISTEIIKQLVPRVPRRLRDGGYEPAEFDRWLQSVNRLLGVPSDPAAFNITTPLVGLDAKVEKTTTVNGHPLSADVVVSASDLTTGTLPHAQLPAIAEADVTGLVADLATKIPDAPTDGRTYVRANGSWQLETPMYATQYDDVGGNISYLGEAAPGSATSAAVWRIRHLDMSSGDLAVTWAGGSDSFTNIWNNRLSLTYS